MNLISVIIPLYNKVHYIERTLESVFAQSFDNYEIVVVNDASTDGSSNLVERIKNDKVTIVNHEENKGLSAARNTGIKHARGDIIALLDADDVWLTNHLEQLFFLVKEYPNASLFGSGWAEQFENGNVLPPKKSLNEKGLHFIVEDFFVANYFQPLVCPSAFAFRKGVIGHIGGFNEAITLGEDVDFYIRSNLEYTFAFYNEVSCLYTYSSENQITAAPIKDKVITDFDSYEAFVKKKPTLKKYLDRKRYFLSIQYKIQGHKERYRSLHKNIDPKNLSFKQHLLHRSPLGVLLFLKRIKMFLLGKKVRVTTF